jgi:hypothetical protein
MKSSLMSNDDEQDLPERLYTHVDRLAGLIGPRHLEKPNTMEVTATYIERQLVDLGYSVDRQVYDVDGSQVDARQCRVRGERIVGMLCLEMVGYYCTEPNSQQIPPGIPRSLRWAFPNPHYHTATDTPDTLDYDRMAQATLGVAGGVKRLAKANG